MYQEFQEADMAVKRLSDLIDAPTKPYSIALNDSDPIYSVTDPLKSNSGRVMSDALDLSNGLGVASKGITGLGAAYAASTAPKGGGYAYAAGAIASDVIGGELVLKATTVGAILGGPPGAVVVGGGTFVLYEFGGGSDYVQKTYRDGLLRTKQLFTMPTDTTPLPRQNGHLSVFSL